MPKIIAALAEVAVFILVMWVLTFLPTFLHELGHALDYMLSTGGRHWHIRVGFGKKLLETKPLTVKLLIFAYSILPVHYAFGEIRGMESDGLQILKAVKHGKKS